MDLWCVLECLVTWQISLIGVVGSCVCLSVELSSSMWQMSLVGVVGSMGCTW